MNNRKPYKRLGSTQINHSSSLNKRFHKSYTACCYKHYSEYSAEETWIDSGGCFSAENCGEASEERAYEHERQINISFINVKQKGSGTCEDKKIEVDALSESLFDSVKEGQVNNQ